MDTVTKWFKSLAQPLSVSTAIKMKIVGMVGVLLAAFAVLYGGMSAPITAPLGNSYRTDIIVVASVTLLHLSYLRIVFSIFLLDRAVENVKIFDLLFPFLLVLVYILYGLHALAFNRGAVSVAHQIEIAAYIMFIVLYVAWFIRDARPGPWREKYERVVWCIADLFVITILALYVLDLWGEGIHLFNYAITPKDLATLTCVFFWGIFRWFAQLFSRTQYKAEYLAYLNHNESATTILTALPSLNLPDKVINVVDFGCGDGRRMVQLLQWLQASGQLKPSAVVKVIGFDRDESWRNEFEVTCRDARIESAFIGADEVALKAGLKATDLLCLSHVLYELDTLRYVRNILPECKQGALVVARGTAARSYYTVVNLAYSRRFPKPTISHLWESHGLKTLIDAGLLKRLGTANVDQPFSLDRGGDTAASQLLQYLYGEAAAQLAKEYFASLLAQGSKIVANDDILVFLQRA